MNFDSTQVLTRKINRDKKEIHVVLIGEEIPDTSIELAKEKPKDYKLASSNLIVLQGASNDHIDLAEIRNLLMEDFYKNSEEQLLEQQHRLALLQKELDQYRSTTQFTASIAPELKALYPEARSLSIAFTTEVSLDSLQVDTLTLAIMDFNQVPDQEEQTRISQWLTARTGARNLRLMINKK